MSECPIDPIHSVNPPTYNGWTILPCPVPLPPWPQQRYFLTNRPGVQNEFEMTMYEDFVDAFCVDHAFARADHHGRQREFCCRTWGAISRIEWIDEKGKHRISELHPRSYRTLPDGTTKRTLGPQLEAKPEWVEAVANRDEGAILRLMRREVAEAAEWVNPSRESLEAFSEQARKQKLLRKERAKKLKEETGEAA